MKRLCWNGKMGELNDKEYFFTSERLGFRAFRPQDIKPFASMNMDRDVMEFFPDLLSEEESTNLMNRLNKHIHEYGFGFFAVDSLQESSFIGFIGIKHTTFDTYFTPCIEIGWRLDKKFWNQGLATEGAKRCITFGFEQLGISEIYSFTALQNAPSERVMQKVGMSKVGEFEHPSLEQDHVLKTHCLYHLTNK